MTKLYQIIQDLGHSNKDTSEALTQLQKLDPKSQKKYKQMGIDEFEKNLEKKIEEERDAERQRMLRELKQTTNKLKTNTHESVTITPDEANKLNKRNQKAQQKENENVKKPSEF